MTFKFFRFQFFLPIYTFTLPVIYFSLMMLNMYLIQNMYITDPYGIMSDILNWPDSLSSFLFLIIITPVIPVLLIIPSEYKFLLLYQLIDFLYQLIDNLASFISQDDGRQYFIRNYIQTAFILIFLGIIIDIIRYKLKKNRVKK
jgi:hypothetical protein